MGNTFGNILVAGAGHCHGAETQFVGQAATRQSGPRRSPNTHTWTHWPTHGAGQLTLSSQSGPPPSRAAYLLGPSPDTYTTALKTQLGGTSPTDRERAKLPDTLIGVEPGRKTYIEHAGHPWAPTTPGHSRAKRSATTTFTGERTPATPPTSPHGHTGLEQTTAHPTGAPKSKRGPRRQARTEPKQRRTESYPATTHSPRGHTPKGQHTYQQNTATRNRATHRGSLLSPNPNARHSPPLLTRATKQPHSGDADTPPTPERGFNPHDYTTSSAPPHEPGTEAPTPQPRSSTRNTLAATARTLKPARESASQPTAYPE